MGVDVATPSTAAIADACVRTGTALRIAPASVRPLCAFRPVAGRALPVRHHGSVDIFLEACGRARPGDVLVIDDGGRLDEACVGDLTVLELRAAGVAAVVVWGAIRDSAELEEIAIPIFGCGRCPAGPRALRPRSRDVSERVRIGAHALVTSADDVFADADGIVFVPRSARETVLAAAAEITATERRQADRARDGERLRDQFRFDAYLARRAAESDYTFRDHLRTLGAEIE
jgi:4-hydroxy-4-methyl-2-oxoglutarate aldolase